MPMFAIFRAAALVLLTLVLGVAPAWAAGKSTKPNIIFILADDLGIPGIGCYGGVYKTPNIDKLAAEGVRFERCFAAPLCAPSRAMLMTGRYAFRTGVLNNGSGAAVTPTRDGCIAQLLKQAGYATAIAGKWRQLSHFTTRAEGARWGFDEFLIWGTARPGDDAGKKDDGEGKGNRYWDPDYNLNGKVLKDAKGKYGPDLLHDFAVDFIQRHKDGPFFLYYPTPLVHSPILATPDSKANSEPKVKKKVKEGGLYAQNIMYLDKLVGKLVAELDRLGIRENTIIVFAGDNGSVPVGTIHGRLIDGKKSEMNEGGSRVPLIANWRGVTPKGVVLKDLIDFSDMLPTFAELGGAKLDADRKIDGRSFAPQLRGQKGQPRDWAYVQLGQQRYVRSDRWKLTGTGELFDMSDAPFKAIPVAKDSNDPAAMAARQTLQSALDSLKSNEPLPKKKKRKTAVHLP